MITFDKPVKFGLIGGLALITFSVLLYAMDVSIFNPVFAIVNFLVIFGVAIFLAVLATNKMRDSDFGGKISYLQALIAGFVVLVIAFYLNNIFSYILTAFIDPEYMPRLVDDFLLNMEGKVPEETFEELMNTMNENIDPMKNLLQSFWINPLMALGISAIVSIFVKKNTTEQLD